MYCNVGNLNNIISYYIAVSGHKGIKYKAMYIMCQLHTYFTSRLVDSLRIKYKVPCQLITLFHDMCAYGDRNQMQSNVSNAYLFEIKIKFIF